MMSDKQNQKKVCIYFWNWCGVNGDIFLNLTRNPPTPIAISKQLEK